jgi:hypothetical protein
LNTTCIKPYKTKQLLQTKSNYDNNQKWVNDWIITNDEKYVKGKSQGDERQMKTFNLKVAEGDS